VNKQTRETDPTLSLPPLLFSSPPLSLCASAPTKSGDQDAIAHLFRPAQGNRAPERVRDCRHQFGRYLLAAPRRAISSLFFLQGGSITSRSRDRSDLDSSCSRFRRAWNRPVAGGDVRIRRGRRVRPLAAGAVHAGRAPIAQGQGDVRIRGLVLRSPTSCAGNCSCLFALCSPGLFTV
jgi:hypothetical protein